MNKKTFGIFMFAIGAATGSLATWKFVETKYKKIADEEIESVKEVFSRRKDDTKPEDDSESDEDDESDTDISVVSQETMTEYNNLANNYKSDSTKKEGEKVSTPYVISPDEFGECDYSTETLTYYADKVLTDDMDNIIEDVDGLVGAESLTHFGEYEEDSVYVRNNDLATDFEILLDVRNYSDVVGDDSHPVSEE